MRPKKRGKPAPDLKAATAHVLDYVANWMEQPSFDASVYGHLGRVTREEADVLEEAKKLAVNYVRMGAK